MTRFIVTAQVRDTRTRVIDAATKEAAIEKAERQLKREGIETIAFKAEQVKGT